MKQLSKSHEKTKENTKVRIPGKKAAREAPEDDNFIPDAEHPDNHTGFTSFSDTLS